METEQKSKVITIDEAWEIAKKIGELPPYRGYMLDLHNGQVMTCEPDGKFRIEEKESLIKLNVKR